MSEFRDINSQLGPMCYKVFFFAIATIFFRIATLFLRIATLYLAIVTLFLTILTSYLAIVREKSCNYLFIYFYSVAETSFHTILLKNTQHEEKNYQRMLTNRDL